MSYISRILELPQDLQAPMLRVAEALEQDLRSELAVRRGDVDDLRVAVSQLTEAQIRTEQRVEELAEAQKRTEQRVEELAEAQKRTEQRMSRLEVVVAELAEAQKRTEERMSRLEIVVAELAEAQRRTEATLTALIVRVDRLDQRLSRVVGDNLERRYREKAFAFFGPILRQVRVIPLQDIVTDLERHLNAAEVDELIPIDLLVQGRVKHAPTMPDVWLAIEVSAVVDRGDVERAVRRAALLRRAGAVVIPAVAGEEVTEGAPQAAQEGKVLLLQDGCQFNWDEALTAVLGADSSAQPTAN